MRRATAGASLKTLGLLGRLPEKDREQLGKSLSSLKFKDGSVIFEEGSRGDSLYFVVSGRVLILKRAWKGRFKEMALFGPGDWFGEVALFGASRRSARAAAVGDVTIVRLTRAALGRWIKSRPKLAVELLLEMARGQALRLARTTADFALLYFLSRLLLEGAKTASELMAKALPHLAGAWEGRWSAAAFIYNPFNEDMEFAAGSGRGDFSALAQSLVKNPQAKPGWGDAWTLSVPLRSKDKLLGALFLRPDAAPSPDLAQAVERTMEAAAPLLCSALENIGFHAEESMRARLASASYGREL